MLHRTAAQAGKEPAPMLTAIHIGKPGAGWARRTRRASRARTAECLAVPRFPLCVAGKGFGRWLAKDGGGAWASCASCGARCGREGPGSAGRRVAASVRAASAAARWAQGKPQHPSPARVPAVTLPGPGHLVVLLPSASIQATVSGSVFVCIQGRFAY